MMKFYKLSNPEDCSIQLDERRIGSKQALRKARGNIRRRDVFICMGGLVWNQVRHIAEVLDMNGKLHGTSRLWEQISMA